MSAVQASLSLQSAGEVQHDCPAMGIWWHWFAAQKSLVQAMLSLQFTGSYWQMQLIQSNKGHRLWA
jgi:hypothetical protein